MLTNGTLMAAYPDYASYRDAHVYGTYPRKNMQNGDLSPLTNGGAINGGAINGSAIPPRMSVNVNGNGNGYMTSENGTIRGILRNKYDIGGAIRPSTILSTHDADANENNSDATSEHLYTRSQKLRRAFRNCSSIIDRYMRPAVAELVAVTFSVFIVTMIESELFDQNIDLLPRISIVAAVEGVCMLVFLLTFRRIHMNPAITLSQLFSASTSWRLCLIFLVMQLLGSIGGIFLYQAVKTEGPPPVAMIPYETATAWVRGAYRLVLCQTIAAFMVVLSHLLATGKRKKGDFAEVLGNPVGIIGAVMLMSFISLLHSTASWNPIRTFAASIAATVGGYQSSAWLHHYVYWLGPVIGSLFASFLYRLIFADGEKRLIDCGCHPTTQ